MFIVVERIRAGHGEDIFTVPNGIIGAACLGITSIATGRLLAGFISAVRILDFGKLDRFVTDAVKYGFLYWQEFPLIVLGYWHSPGTEGGAVRQRLVAAFQKCLYVIGNSLAVAHGHDDGRATKSPVTGGKYLGIIGAHCVPVGAHAVRQHHAFVIQLGA